MHYLITGHTGFKGTWLSLWLTSLGHKVSGISLDPEQGALFQLTGAGDLLAHDFRLDIRNADEVTAAVKEVSSDVVIHMAAQPLVRESFFRATASTRSRQSMWHAASMRKSSTASISRWSASGCTIAVSQARWQPHSTGMPTSLLCSKPLRVTLNSSC